MREKFIERDQFHLLALKNLSHIMQEGFYIHLPQYKIPYYLSNMLFKKASYYPPQKVLRCYAVSFCMRAS